MAIASLNEVIQSYIQRRNAINVDLTNYSGQKTMGSMRQSDLAAWKNSRHNAIKLQYKGIFSANPSMYKEKYSYVDYTQLPEYQDEVMYVDSYYTAKLEDLTAWETELDNQITTMNVELNEINAYIDSFKSTLSNNIKNDYNYGQS